MQVERSTKRTRSWSLRKARAQSRTSWRISAKWSACALAEDMLIDQRRVVQHDAEVTALCSRESRHMHSLATLCTACNTCTSCNLCGPFTSALCSHECRHMRRAGRIATCAGLGQPAMRWHDSARRMRDTRTEGGARARAHRCAQGESGHGGGSGVLRSPGINERTCMCRRVCMAQVQSAQTPTWAGASRPRGRRRVVSRSPRPRWPCASTTSSASESGASTCCTSSATPMARLWRRRRPNAASPSSWASPASPEVVCWVLAGAPLRGRSSVEKEDLWRGSTRGVKTGDLFDVGRCPSHLPRGQNTSGEPVVKKTLSRVATNGIIVQGGGRPKVWPESASQTLCLGQNRSHWRCLNAMEPDFAVPGPSAGLARDRAKSGGIAVGPMVVRFEPSSANPGRSWSQVGQTLPEFASVSNKKRPRSATIGRNCAKPAPGAMLEHRFGNFGITCRPNPRYMRPSPATNSLVDLGPVFLPPFVVRVSHRACPERARHPRLPICSSNNEYVAH